MLKATDQESGTSDRRQFRFRNVDALLRNVVENAAVPTFVDRIDGRIIYANQASCDLLGYTADEINRLGFDQLIHADDAENAKKRYAALVAGELKGYSAERRYRRKDGTLVWVLVSAAPILDESTGEVAYITIQAIDIDRLKRTEIALAESEARWNFALENSGQGVWDYNFRTGSMYLSPMWKVMRGLDPAENTAPSLEYWLSRVHPDDRERARTKARQQYDGEISTESFEYRELHNKGHYIWILSRGRPVEWFPDGRPARMIGTDTDITSLKEAEERARSIGAFHNLVIENIPATVVVKDASDLRFLLINRAGEELFGISKSDYIGKTDYDFFPKEQADFFVSQDRIALNSGRVQVTPEEPIDTKKRGKRLLKTVKMAVPDEQGKPKYLLALCEDITDRKKAELALEASEAMFRSLMQASPDAVIVTDETGSILIASDQVETMFGYAVAELAGKSINTLVPERYRKKHVGLIQGYMKQPVPHNMGAGRELSALHKDGHEFPIEISLNHNVAGERPVVIAAIRDVTDRKATELQLRQAQKMEAIGNLTGGMAHDFNNLLGIIIGNLDLLRSQAKENTAISPQIEQLASEALDAALSGADLTKRLLAFARRQPLQPQSIDVNELVGGISKLARRTIGSEIEIKLNLDTAVWPAQADPSQLGASLINLINNACDAMPSGGVLTITTRSRNLDAGYAMSHDKVVPGDYTLIEVSDTGTGIPPELLNIIFEPFFTTKEQGKGTGLGLSMVFGFVKQSKGHISVDSKVCHGTTFRLYLPRAASVADVPEAAKVTGRGGGETVLAVDDNEGLLRVAVRQLSDLGYRVLEAKNGATALEVLAREPVTLLFTDIVMPGTLSGYDLARVAVSRWPTLKVLLTSGFPENTLKGDFGTLGKLTLLSKPYRTDDLAQALRKALDGDQ